MNAMFQQIMEQLNGQKCETKQSIEDLAVQLNAKIDDKLDISIKDLDKQFASFDKRFNDTKLDC